MIEHISTLPKGWREALKSDLSAEYFADLLAAVDLQYKNHKVYPPKEQIFRALTEVDLPDVRVCILGQDPYHGAGQANGMAFAVCDGEKHPPSLMNIFKELRDDLKFNGTLKSDLCGWAKQGVLLLNTTLTVREGEPQSHAGLSWQKFTDSVISALSKRDRPLAFILWGSSAGAKKPLISSHHFIVESAHPSPLSASRGFFGSKPFSRVNRFLKEGGVSPIDWSDTGGRRPTYYENAHAIKRI